MSNEGKRFYKQKEQEKLLIEFYDAILNSNSDWPIDQQKKFLLQLLNTKISQLEPNTDRIKIKKNLIYFSIMLASGVTTVLIGLKGRDYSNAALISSSVMTFLSGLAAFWDIQGYWIRNKIMLNKLKEIRYEYVFYLTGNPEPKSTELRPFLERFLVCLGDEYWEKFLKDVKKEPENPTTAVH
jgi:hypothetical protein